MGELILIGAGGHAKVVLESIQARGEHRVIGALDPDPPGPRVLDVPVLGGDEQLTALRERGVEYVFIALGANALRRRVAARAQQSGFRLANAIHPTAVISPSARVGDGVAVMAGAVINASADIGDLSIVNTGAVIDHDCRLGPGAHVAPGSALAGGVDVGEDAFLGVGVRAIPGVRIGARATVGGGAVVIRDIPPDAMAYGVPAQVRNRNDAAGA